MEEESDDDEAPILQEIYSAKEQEEEFRPDYHGDDEVPPRKVPVTILSGFLGSGKTTLVRHILTSPDHGRRIAVIENEFGGGDVGDGGDGDKSLSVETMIATDGHDGSSLSDFIELPNGCVCCTVKDSLVETLELLLAKRADLDYILIECSGMADPGPVASVFWLDDALGSRLGLDGIVTCVDARNLEAQIRSTTSAPPVKNGRDRSHVGGGGDEAARQIALADRIIMNKTDLLEGTSGSVESVIELVRSINPTAPYRITKYSAVDDLGWILDARCFDAERAKDVVGQFDYRSSSNGAVTELLLQFGGGGRCLDPNCTMDHTLTSDGWAVCAAVAPLTKSSHHHTGSVGAITLYSRGSVDLRNINSWLASVLWPDQDEDDAVLTARLGEAMRREQRSSDGSDGEVGEAAHVGALREESDGCPTVYRVKGVLSVRHPTTDDGQTVISSSNEHVDDGLSDGSVNPRDGTDNRRYIVQAVADLWDVTPAGRNLDWDTGEDRSCKVIVIGRWLDRDVLEAGFRDCFVDCG